MASAETEKLILEELGKAWKVLFSGMGDKSAEVIEGCVPNVEQVAAILEEMGCLLNPSRDQVQVAVLKAILPPNFRRDFEVGETGG